MLEPSLKPNDRKAKMLIGIFSVVVFLLVALMGRFHFAPELPFNVHIFAKANGVINSVVSFLLIAALVAVKQKKYLLHKRIMLGAMLLSILFLVCYISHHLLSAETRFGDMNHDGILDEFEKANCGRLRFVYYAILGTHIVLASLILPFILFTAYRGLTAEYEKHKKLTRITWPIWLYVSITGVVVYLMISPYY
ncbi:DUF420 domain-containing protein [soil metagenome]